MDFNFKIYLVAVFMVHDQVHSAPRLPRLSVAESPITNYFYNNIEGNPGVYSFNYDVSDDATGNAQYRTEDRYANGTVSGAYGYVDAFGTPRRFRYIADQAGYRVFQENIFKPFIYGYQTSTLKPIDKIATHPTESSVTWTRPSRPKKNKNQSNKALNSGRRKYNLIGPPSQYVPYN